MVAKTNTMMAESRTANGSSSARRLRHGGLVPAVVYNDKGEARSIQLNRHGFENLLKHGRSENVLMDLVIGKAQPQKVLIKDVQHDPITSFVIHVDFLEVSMTSKMRVRIPIVLHGDPVGVTQEAGILEQPTRELDVECLPGDLIEVIDLDVSGLKLGQSIKVSELKVSDKLTVLTHPEIAVALVSVPRKEEEEVKPEEAGAEAGAEPEVIGEKKDGEEGAEEGEGGEKGEKKSEKGAAAKGAEKGAAAAKGAEKGAAPAKGAEKKPEKGAAKGGEKKEERKK